MSTPVFKLASVFTDVGNRTSSVSSQRLPGDRVILCCKFTAVCLGFCLFNAGTRPGKCTNLKNDNDSVILKCGYGGMRATDGTAKTGCPYSITLFKRSETSGIRGHVDLTTKSHWRIKHSRYRHRHESKLDDAEMAKQAFTHTLDFSGESSAIPDPNTYRLYKPMTVGDLSYNRALIKSINDKIARDDYEEIVQIGDAGDTLLALERRCALWWVRTVDNKEYNYLTPMDARVSSEIEAIFFIFPSQLKVLPLFPFSIAMDSTYKTNSRHYRLVNFVLVNSMSKIMPVSHSFIHNETGESMKWVVSKFKEVLYDPANDQIS